MSYTPDIYAYRHPEGGYGATLRGVSGEYQSIWVPAAPFLSDEILGLGASNTPVHAEGELFHALAALGALAGRLRQGQPPWAADLVMEPLPAEQGEQPAGEQERFWRLTLWFDGFEHIADDIAAVVTEVQGEVIGLEARYSTTNELNRDSLERLVELESPPYGWPRGTRMPTGDDSLNMLVVVVRVREASAKQLRQMMAELSEGGSAGIMQDIPEDGQAPLLVGPLGSEFERRARELTAFAAGLPLDQRELPTEVQQGLLAVAGPLPAGPSLTLEQVLAYLHARGWKAREDPRWLGGYYAYREYEEKGEIRHDGTNIRDAFLMLVRRDVGALFDAMERPNHST